MNLDGRWIGKSSGFLMIVSGDKWAFHSSESSEERYSGKISEWNPMRNGGLSFEEWLISRYKLDEVETAKKIIESYDL